VIVEKDNNNTLPNLGMHTGIIEKWP